MNPWDVYKSRLESKGRSRRDSAMRREVGYIERKLQNSGSYHSLKIEGKSKNVAVINSDSLYIKVLCSLPGEDLPYGGEVEWSNQHWIITDKDSNNELYTKAKMTQCNHLLKWVADDNTIVERWCIIDDGTKYMTGELGTNYFVVTSGDSRIAMILPRDEYTVKLNRTSRFLIDDDESSVVLAYRLTKPLKIGKYRNEDTGILSFVLSECDTEDTDNFDLKIANYYKYFPREKEPDYPKPENDTDRKKVWL